MKALLLLPLLYCSTSFAQNTVVVKAGTPISKAFTHAELYQYPEFRQGRVFYKDGHSSGGRLNYHRFYDEMLFLDKADTLAVDNEPTIRLITVGSDSFYYADGFVRVISTAPAVKLAVRQWLRIIDQEKYGGYGQTTASSAIMALKTLDDGRRPYNLVVKVNLVVSRQEDYYFGDRWERFLPATRKNLLELFPKQSSGIRAYLKAHEVNFKSREDLEKLADYLRGLEE